MVVCKCRKATKLYCFVHEVPVCGECICFPEHQTCVVRAYSEWVINGEYDWPPTCCKCQADVKAETNPKLSRLGCLHIIHTECLISHIQSSPPNTAPAGYVCPLCSSSLWPPKSIKDSGSLLHLKLREAFSQSGLEKNILGDQMVSHPIAAPHGPPPAFASDPLVSVSADVKEGRLSDRYNPEIGNSLAKLGEEGIVELDVSGNGGNQFSSTHEQGFSKSTSPGAPGATTRKSAAHTVDRQNSEISYYADDEDGNRKKYTRRGPFRHKFFRFLLPFWSSALPTLPVTAPPAKESREGPGADDLTEGRPRKRASRMDPRKILLFLAIMACLATMAILYYRLAQRSFLDDVPEDNRE